MRDRFIAQFLSEIESHPESLLITGDLGFGVLTELWEKYPDQFLNAGVAEQNMTGIAAGLALEGHTVFTYSIANFPTLRCLEQIRNDVLYHEVPVNIVAVGGGFSYGSLGMSHHATEDVSIMRSLPGLRIFTPCDEAETAAAVSEMLDSPAPSYIRLDKSKWTGSAVDSSSKSLVASIREIRHGGEVAIVSYGGVVSEVMACAELLDSLGHSVAVYSVPKIKPLDEKLVVSVIETFDKVVTVEEHLKNGGIGTLVSELCSDYHLKCKLLRLGLPDAFCSVVGSQDYLRKSNGLDSESLAKSIGDFVRT